MKQNAEKINITNKDNSKIELNKMKPINDNELKNVTGGNVSRARNYGSGHPCVHK